MTNELTNPEMCVYLRNGIEIWVKKSIAENLGNDLVRGAKAMVVIGGQYVNTVEIVGIFDPIYLEDLKRRKQGMWKCNFGGWHEKGGICECARNRMEVWKPPVEIESSMPEEKLAQGIAIIDTLRKNKEIKSI